MYLKILYFSLFVTFCTCERNYYDVVPFVKENDLSSSHIPLELYQLPDEDTVPQQARVRRSLLHDTTSAPDDTESISNLPNSPGSIGTNPTLQDKKPTGFSINKSKTIKKTAASGVNVNLDGKKLIAPPSVNGSTPAPYIVNVEKTNLNSNILAASQAANIGSNIGSPNNNYTHVTSDQSIVSIGASSTTSAPSTSTLVNVDDPPMIEDILNNKTLLQHNITSTTNDTHIYYNSSSSRDEQTAKKYWVDLHQYNSKINEILSNAHRRAMTQKLSFDFPFYGHMVRNITIATGGFLYTGDYVHSWLAATQYIAPLMANFDTQINNDSVIRFADNSTQFTVQWENVRLQDKPEAGSFTFQCTLFNTGDIVFVYKNIPIVAIDDEHHPVKVGLSDAYILDKTVFFVRRKSIYEYHKIQFSQVHISNWTSIYLTALPTCLNHKDCESCLDDQELPCNWCPTAGRCSTGLDRKRQNWIDKKCDRYLITTGLHCDAAGMYSHLGDNDEHDLVPLGRDGSESQKSSKFTISSLLFTLLCVICVVGLVAWGFYAYTNPMTSSGQILIRYRPSQWVMKRGEARYTAATIHM